MFRCTKNRHQHLLQILALKFWRLSRQYLETFARRFVAFSVRTRERFILIGQKIVNLMQLVFALFGTVSNRPFLRTVFALATRTCTRNVFHIKKIQATCRQCVCVMYFTSQACNVSRISSQSLDHKNVH